MIRLRVVWCGAVLVAWCAWARAADAPAKAAGPPKPYEASFDFSKSARDGQPVGQWRTTGFTWEVRNGALVCEDGEKSFAVLASAPHGRQVTVEATVTPRQARGREWKTAGLVVHRDDRNYWHLAMIESPTKADGRVERTFELKALAAGETWQGDDAALRVFGVAGPAEKKPWNDLADDLKARASMVVRVRR